MMKVTWNTNTGPFNKVVPEDEVMDFLRLLDLLGFTATVDMLD